MTLEKSQFTTIMLIAISGALLVGCGQSATPAVVESIVSTPEKDESLTSPQPTATTIPASRATLPTPSSSDVGVVGGVLLRDLESGESTAGAETTLQLGRVIRDDEGTPLAVSAGETSSPTTTTGENGDFVFTDVPPDTYGLVLVSPVGSFMIKDETGNDFLIDVESGQAVDLGEVHTDVPY
jgi:hypothetical protein